MDLAQESKRIDDVLSQEYKRWEAEVQEKERVIEAQDKILQSDEAQGDRSENAVFQNAIDAKQQAMLDKTLLEEKMREYRRNYSQYSQNAYTPTGIVKLGSVVRFTVVKTGKEFIVKLVPSKADSPLQGAISVTSIAGGALLNKKAGDKVKCLTVRGEQEYIIQEVY